MNPLYVAIFIVVGVLILGIVGVVVFLLTRSDDIVSKVPALNFPFYQQYAAASPYTFQTGGSSGGDELVQYYPELPSQSITLDAFTVHGSVTMMVLKPDIPNVHESDPDNFADYYLQAVPLYGRPRYDQGDDLWEYYIVYNPQGNQSPVTRLGETSLYITQLQSGEAVELTNPDVPSWTATQDLTVD